MIDRFKSDLKEAMRKRDTISISTLRMLISQVQYARIEAKCDLNDDDYIALLRRGVKTRRESIAQFEKGGRAELAARERLEIEVIARYLPAAMSPEETERAVVALLKELAITERKDMGRAMKEFMARYAARVDGKAVNALIASRLG